MKNIKLKKIARVQHTQNYKSRTWIKRKINIRKKEKRVKSWDSW